MMGGGTLNQEMSCQIEERSDIFGMLPAMAPLANPYVPFQQQDAKRYTAQRGLVRGTLFPGLDLPFMGMVNKTDKPNTPMHELQALSFALTELGEYLDTHRNDTEAAEVFAKYAVMYEAGVKKYEQAFGPLCQKNATANGAYRWLNDPWPWDAAGNREA